MPKDSPDISQENRAAPGRADARTDNRTDARTDGARQSDAGTQPGAAPAAPPPARKRRRRKWRLILMLLGPLVVLAGAGYYYVTGGRYVSTDNAYIKSDIVMISAQVSGPITEVAVRTNQHVNKGDVLFRIDDRPYKIALNRAEAALAGVRDQIEGLKAEYRQKQAQLALARTNVAFAQKEFDRYSKLLANRTVSQSTYDGAAHTLDVARQQVQVDKQDLAQTRTQLSGKPDAPVEQMPQYQQAKAARDQAALDLSETVIRAPFAGIASKVPEPGQQVTGNAAFATPVMSIVADRGDWIDANFKETQLTHVKPGQPVTVSVDTYPNHSWHGKVQSISQATGAEFSVIPPQNATGNWVKVVQRITVRIAVDETGDKTGDGPRLRSGMSATVDIDTGHRRALPGFISGPLAWLGLRQAAAQTAPQTGAASKK